MKLTHAIMLAAGLGTRMRPLTESIPKPLIPVRGKTLIDWNLEWLETAGIKNIVINSSYRAAQLEAHVAARAGVRIAFSREEPEPLETGGGIAKALPLLGEGPFLAMNADAIFPAQPIHPITRLAEAWDDSLDFLMLVVPRARVIGSNEKGDFVMDDAGRIRRPHAGENAPYVFTGVEIIHPRVFAGCPNGKFSLSLFWNQRAAPDGWHRNIRAIIHDGPWLNVGDLAGLAAAEKYLS